MKTENSESTKITQERAKEVEAGMDLWRGKEPNTMENMTEVLTKLFKKHNPEFRFDPQVSHRWIVNAFIEYGYHDLCKQCHKNKVDSETLNGKTSKSELCRYCKELNFKLLISGSVAAPKEEPNLTAPIWATDDVLESIQRLSYKCLQWQYGEIKGYDVQMMESLLPIITRPLFNELTAIHQKLKELIPIAEYGVKIKKQILEYTSGDTDAEFEIEENDAIIARVKDILNKKR